MVAINKVILVGPVYQIKKIETRSGKDMLVFTLKTWRPMGKNEDGTKKDDKVAWHKVAAYAGASKVLGQYLTEGKCLYIEGSIDYYKDSNDVERTQIVVEEFTFIGE